MPPSQSSSPQSPARQLVERVRAATAGTPYVVEDRPDGFALTVDIVDSAWWTVLRKNSVKRVFTHEVRLDEAKRRLVITDVAHEVRWDAGIGAGGRPTLHAEQSVRKGRVLEFSSEKQWGVAPATGDVGTVVDYTFRAGEGRGLVREAASALGWSEGMGPEQRLGLAAGVFALGLVAVIGVVAAVILLTG